MRAAIIARNFSGPPSLTHNTPSNQNQSVKWIIAMKGTKWAVLRLIEINREERLEVAAL
jgi:hypothetical protein